MNEFNLQLLSEETPQMPPAEAAAQEDTAQEDFESLIRGKYKAQFDARVQGILAKYRAELEQINAETTPLETLWEHYCEEKASTEAYYISKYLQ